MPMHVAMRATQVFPDMVTQMIAIGEESGAVDEMLSKIATIYEAEVDDIELNLSQTLYMNKSINNDTQNTRFMKRLKKVVIEGSKINKQKELQLIAEEIILQRRQNNVIEGSVLLPKDFSKADQSSTVRADETNLKSRR